MVACSIWFAGKQPEAVRSRYDCGALHGRDKCTHGSRVPGKEEVKASAHLVIGRQGELFQLVPFDTEAWHAGRSCYGGRANLNRYSIGIEFGQSGGVYSGKRGRFVAECGVEVAPADVYVDDTGEVATFWHRYTERQKRLLREICRLLKQHYPIRYVVGHSDITDRKQDPGPELHGFMCK